MTQAQIIGEVVIGVVVGIFLIVIGVILQPPLNRLWERMNRPQPLTPQNKAQLQMNRTLWEAEMERLEYLSTNKKDLFLLQIQLMMLILLTTIAALWLYAFRQLVREGGPPVDFISLMVVVLLSLAGVAAGVGLWQAGRLSDKKIDATKGSVQKHIDEIDRQLNPTTHP